MRTTLNLLVAALLLALSLAAGGVVGCSSADTTRDPEQADASADNPAEDLDVGDAGLGARSPGQPSPWERFSVPIKSVTERGTEIPRDPRARQH